MNSKRFFDLVATASILMAHAGCSSPGDDSEAMLGGLTQAVSVTGDPQAKIELCHVPPGRPADRQTIVVSAASVSSHLAHGDGLGECASACSTESCNDENSCTADACGPDGTCAHVAVNCDDGNPCTVDSCVDGIGCTAVPAAGSAACDDGNECTGGDVCDNGACSGQPITGCCHDEADCADGNLCTDDSCLDGVCVNSEIVCATTDPCLAAFCDPNVGACETAPVSCDDGNGLTLDFCDSSLGCRSVLPEEIFEMDCIDGIDNDSDGMTDLDDDDCDACVCMGADVGLTICHCGVVVCMTLPEQVICARVF